MGTPDTSAGIGLPNSLVENLVSQGNMLNQGEVYWETGELLGPDEHRGHGGLQRRYDDYNFDIVNTEIARRASLLVQPISKAVAAVESSPNGEAWLAIPSWKQGPMRQGGPADTMLRRVVLPEGYGGGTTPEECPIDENVDADQPVVEFARYFLLANGNGRIEVQVDGLDGDPTTAVQTNNAVTDERIVRRTYDTAPWIETDDDFYYRIAVGPGSSRPVPCAIQVADVDADGLQFGPWIAVKDAPADCEGPIPAECLCDIDDNVDTYQPEVETATFRFISTGARRLQVTVSGYDGLTNTRLQLRNAATTDLYGYPRSVDETGTSVTYNINADTWSEIPCAIQVADWDVADPAFGPWVAVDTSALPEGESCVGEIPPACADEGAADAVFAAETPGIEVNPYAFENMACENWLFRDEFNPYYPKGVCLDPATNLSGVVPDTCIDDGTGGDVPCPTVDFTTSTFGIGDTNPILQGVVQGEGNQTRVLTWHQCPSDGAQTTGVATVTCEGDDRDGRVRQPAGSVLVQPAGYLQGPQGLPRRQLRAVPVRLVAELAAQRQGQRPLRSVRTALVRRW